MGGSWCGTTSVNLLVNSILSPCFGIDIGVKKNVVDIDGREARGEEEVQGGACMSGLLAANLG